MSDGEEPKSPDALIDGLERAFLASAATPARWAAVDAARARAQRFGSATADSNDDLLKVVVFLAEALAGSALESPWSSDEIHQLMEAGARASEFPTELVTTATYLRLVREPGLLQLPPQLSLETQLGLLCAFSGATQASLWEADGDGRVRALAAAGSGPPGARARAEARRVLDGEKRPAGLRARLHGIPVTQWQQRRGALVIRVEPERRDRALALAEDAARALSVILERDSLIKRSVAQEQTLVAVTERRLARLGFDLHDGALQDVSALAGEVRHLRRQLPRLLDDAQPIERTAGRLDDVEARLVALDRDLRELARSFESPAVLRRSFPEAIRNEVEALSRRTRIETSVRLEGDFEALTESQKIALYRIVQEALSNAREHSGAKSVSVTIVAEPRGVHLEIADNGTGFDVEARLLRAARSGHLGLVGMNERVRLLGGTFHLQSRSGGPTKVEVHLPQWRPLASEPVAEPPAQGDEQVWR